MIDTESSFNTVAKEIFNSSLCSSYAFIDRLVEQIEPKLKATKVHHIDINKCRKNILYFSEYEYPVFSVMDEPVNYNGQTGAGLYYIEKPEAYFPLRGNGWYYEPMINYCLKNNIVQPTDIKYVIKSSLNIKPNHYNEFIDYLYSNLEDDLKKLAVNGMIGSFKPKPRENWKSLCITRSANEAYNKFLALKGSFIEVRDINKTNFYQVYSKYMTETDETEAPIYNQVLELEAIALHELATLVKDNKGTVLDLNTDCVSCVFENDIFPFTVSDDAVNIEGFYYDEAKTLPKYKIEHKDERLKEPRMGMYMRNATYRHKQLEWNRSGDVIDNDFKPLVDQILNSKKSIVINGRAGCGKSTLIKMIQAELAQKGIEQKSLAPTNKACRIIDGTTLHKFTISHSRKSLMDINWEYIIIDEISMVSEKFYKFFITLHRIRPDIKFIIAGDFAQLLPVNDRIEDLDYENSPALHELADGNHLLLSTCRRSDNELYNMCLPENIVQITKDDFTNNKSRINICFTNATRKKINKEKMTEAVEANKKGKKQKVVNLKAYVYDENSQDVSLLPLMPVIARMTSDEYNIMNNETFTIKKVSEEFITLTSADKDSIACMDIPTEDFTKLFHIAFCITCHKSQGETYNHPYTIHEWNKMDSRLKYVALSRATQKQFINLI
jgi:energy-coupling factor transporter ATP-binding protein EcfA2